MIITTIIGLVITPVLWAIARIIERKANYRQAMRDSAALDRSIAQLEKRA